MSEFFAKLVAELVFKLSVYLIEKIATKAFSDDVTEAIRERFTANDARIKAALSALRSVYSAVVDRLDNLRGFRMRQLVDHLESLRGFPMRQLAEFVLANPNWKREIVNNHPAMRGWCAAQLGKWNWLPAPLPLEYNGRILSSEHLSVDFLENQKTGPILEWYERFLLDLEQFILSYPDAETLNSVLIDQGGHPLRIHFNPIDPNARFIGLTKTFIDGHVENNFFKYVYAFTTRFLASRPAPMRLYCLLEIDPLVFQETLRTSKRLSVQL